MPMLKLTVGQVIELVKQLPKEEKYAVLQALNLDKETRSNGLKREQEQQLRAFSAKRGLNWDSLSEDDRDVLKKSLLTNK